MRRLIALFVSLYRCMLLLYPASFRELYAAEMEEIFRRELQGSQAHKVVLLLLREIGDLPMSLLGAYRRQRRLLLATQQSGGMGVADFESKASRSRLLLWGTIVAFVAIVIFATAWLILYNGYHGVPELRGTSAIIVGNSSSFVRLPQSAYQCEVKDGENKAHCAATIGDKELRLTLAISGQGTSSYTGTCTGSYAGQPVSCLQLFMRARDRGMPPVLVHRPFALAQVEWQALVRAHAFTFPAARDLYYWWIAFNVLVSLAVAVFMWFVSGSPQVRGGIRPLLFRLAGSVVAGVAIFFPLSWFSLLLRFGLESWVERF